MANQLKQIDGQQVLRSVFDPDTNRLRVDASISAQIGQVEVVLDHDEDSVRLGDGANLTTTTTVGSDVGLDVNLITQDVDIRDLSASQDNIAISDGTDTLDVNSDGTIDVNVSTKNSAVDIINIYNEVLSVPASSSTTINTYTISAGKDALLQKITASGTNIAEYEITINGTTIDKKRTYFGSAINTEFNFVGPNNGGYELSASDVIRVNTIHTRPSTGDFNARIQLIEF